MYSPVAARIEQAAEPRKRLPARLLKLRKRAEDGASTSANPSIMKKRTMVAMSSDLTRELSHICKASYTSPYAATGLVRQPIVQDGGYTMSIIAIKRGRNFVSCRCDCPGGSEFPSGRHHRKTASRVVAVAALGWIIAVRCTVPQWPSEVAQLSLAPKQKPSEVAKLSLAPKQKSHLNTAPHVTVLSPNCEYSYSNRPPTPPDL